MIQETTCVERFIDLLTTRISDVDEICKATNLVFHNRVPRDYVINRIENVLPKYRERLAELREIPVIEQRSQEWYDARKSIITASDFAQALGEGKFGTQKQFYQKKCGYESEKFDPYVPPLKWGCMFESVAADIYANRNHVTLHEFGLLRHPTVSYFGASPDGITEHGIMLEIKCPFKRKITGEVPQQYLLQVQGQLDVCDLEECDYLECEFVTDHDADFWFTFNEYPFEQGVIVEMPRGTADVPVYKYNPFGASKDELRQWMLNETIPGCMIHEWRLKQYNVVRIYRDAQLLNEKFDQLKDVWDNVERYRTDKGAYDRETATISRGGAASKRATAATTPQPESDPYSFTFRTTSTPINYSFRT